MKIKRSFGERLGHAIILIILILFAFSTVYPFWHVIMYSLSDSGQAMSGGLFFIPRKTTLLAYRTVLKTKQIFVAYRNTIMKTVLGTCLSLLVTSLAAFPMSLKRLRGRTFFNLYFYFTMLFGGGMIPTYLVVEEVGLIDSFWALIVPGMVSAYNLFILRNCFASLPSELEESAYIDGAIPPVVLFKIIIPIAAPSLAAIAMFYAVNNWNAYLDCILYTNSTKLQVLQVYLRELISVAGAMDIVGPVATEQTTQLTSETMKMTTIAVSIIPILIIYPALQRFYTTGLTVGAVKG